jgi:apurinic endonuclease APN1
MNSKLQYYNINGFGSHIGYKSNMKDTICSCINQHMYSCQFFLGNRLSLTRSKCTTKDIEEANEYFKKWKLNVYTHIPYCINLSGKGGKIAYQTNNDDNDEATQYAKKCVQSIQSELDVLHQLKCNQKGSIVHIGSIGDNKNITDGLNAVVKSINSINCYTDTPLCLETMVGCGGVLGKSIEELKYIIDRVDNKEGIGICLDTCHLFAEGSYNLSEQIQIDALFKDYFWAFGLDKIKVIHFNDSLDVFGSKKDRHSTIGDGYIWKHPTQNNKLNQSCKYFINKCVKENINIILETEPEDYEKVVSLYNK